MSIHADDLRDIANNHGWPVCELAADEIEELERTNATLSAENEKLKLALTAPVATEQAQEPNALNESNSCPNGTPNISTQPRNAAATSNTKPLGSGSPERAVQGSHIPELVTVGAMHRCRADAKFDQCVSCGAIAEELSKPCKTFVTEATALAASPEAAPAASTPDYPPLPDKDYLGDDVCWGYDAQSLRDYVDADRKERQLSACNFCLAQAAEARAAATPAAPSAATDEQIAALKARFGVTSNGRGIREFTQVKDFALAVAALAQPAPVQQPHAVPDSVWEALQRLIENAASLGPASQDDALLVAKYRDRARFMAAPLQQDAPAPSMVGDAVDALRQLVEQIEKASPVDDHGHLLTMNTAFIRAKEML